MPVWKAKLCYCTVHGCGTKRDPDTGQLGVQLSPSMFKKHQHEEKMGQMKRNLESQAIVAQRRALETVENTLERAMQLLSVQEPATETIRAKEEQYMHEQKEKMAALIGEILDNIRLRGKQISAIDIPGEKVFSNGEIDKAIQLCHEVRALNSSALRDLNFTKSGPLRKQASIKYLRHNAYQEIERLNEDVGRVETIWKERRIMKLRQIVSIQHSVPNSYESKHHFLPYKHMAPWLPVWVVDVMQMQNFMVVVGYVILGFSRRACYFVFSMCEYMAQRTGEAVFNKFLPNWLLDVFASFPLDVRASTKRFDIEPKFIVYAACPKCNEIYKPTPVDNIPTYRERCNARKFGNRCGELLVRPKKYNNKSINVPIKPFLSFDFQDWLAGILSRRGYEKAMDDAWKKTSEPVQENGRIDDIFQSNSIRNFKGCDKKFFGQSGNETTGRYLFALGFDFFNPLRNLTAGKKISIGVIALTCLNLPITVRYKPENIFLAGIIPGPNEPSLEAANPYFRPIVDTFLLLWVGVFFTQTALHAMGRIILCALLAIIADLPAARKAGGFASYNHEFFCSVCWCSKTVHTFNSFDYENWTWRTDDECRDGAWSYEAASSEKTAASLFDKSGLRTSEFHRLPYYRPTMSLVVDPMHNLFLGLIKEHFQHILGDGSDLPKQKKKHQAPLSSDCIILPDLDGTESNPLPTSDSGQKGIRNIRRWLADPLPIEDTDVAGELARKNTAEAIVFVGKHLGCIPSTITNNGKDTLNGMMRVSKENLAKMLVNWRKNRSAQVQTSQATSEVDGKQGKILTPEDMKSIRRDISAMVKPSWVASLPLSMSGKSGKLKSDQWRIAAALYIPVTLIRLWSGTNSSKPTQTRRELLRLTMLLFEAISVITSRVVSPAMAYEYLNLMVQYRYELSKQFPSYQCVPNHHMAMHMGEFALEYGPVHGWWTFPFERMIGMLQRIPTNYKQEGEYEETIGTTWHRRSNLTAIFERPGCPQVIRDCWPIFRKLVMPQGRNILAGETETIDSANGEADNEADDEADDEESEETLEEGIQYNDSQAVLLKINITPAFLQYGVPTVPTRAMLKNRYRVGRISYTSWDVHEGNSGVLNASNVPYRIKNVLKFSQKVSGDDIWFVVNRYQEAGVENDPYIPWVHFRAKLWGTDVQDSLEVLPFSAVAGHFAKCIIPWEDREVAVCVSLSRLRPVDRQIL